MTSRVKWCRKIICKSSRKFSFVFDLFHKVSLTRSPQGIFFHFTDDDLDRWEEGVEVPQSFRMALFNSIVTKSVAERLLGYLPRKKGSQLVRDKLCEIRHPGHLHSVKNSLGVATLIILLIVFIVAIFFYLFYVSNECMYKCVAFDNSSSILPAGFYQCDLKHLAGGRHLACKLLPRVSTLWLQGEFHLTESVKCLNLTNSSCMFG
jgi:hypothetical protein